MGYTVYYQLTRRQPLTDAERRAIAVHARAWWDRGWDGEPYALELAAAPRADGLLACGWSKIGYDLDCSDAEQILEALTELRGLVAGASLYVSDDLELVAWDEDEQAYIFDQPHAQEVPELGDLDDGVAAHTLVDSAARSSATVGAALEAAASAGDDVARQTVATLLVALAAAEDPSDEAERLTAALRALPADRVHQTAWRDFAALRNTRAWELVVELADDVDPSAYADDVLALWQRDDASRYWYVDLERAMPGSFVREPRVEAELIAYLVGWRDLAGGSGEDRVEAAALLIGRHGADVAGAVALADLARQHWRRDGSFSPIRHDAAVGLCSRAEPEVTPSLELEIAFAGDKLYRAHWKAVEALCRHLGGDAIPYVRWALERDDSSFDEVVIRGLAHLGAAVDRARRCAARHPDTYPRHVAAQALGDAAAEPEPPFATATQWRQAMLEALPGEAVRFDDDRIRALEAREAAWIDAHGAGANAAPRHDDDPGDDPFGFGAIADALDEPVAESDEPIVESDEPIVEGDEPIVEGDEPAPAIRGARRLAELRDVACGPLRVVSLRATVTGDAQRELVMKLDADAAQPLELDRLLTILRHEAGHVVGVETEHFDGRFRGARTFAWNEYLREGAAAETSSVDFFLRVREVIDTTVFVADFAAATGTPPVFAALEPTHADPRFRTAASVRQDRRRVEVFLEIDPVDADTVDADLEAHIALVDGDDVLAEKATRVNLRRNARPCFVSRRLRVEGDERARARALRIRLTGELRRWYALG